MAENSARSGLLLVRAQAHLRDSGELRQTDASYDGTCIRRFGHNEGLMESKERRRLHHCTVQGRAGPGILGAALAGARGIKTGSAEDAARTADSSRVAGQS